MSKRSVCLLLALVMVLSVMCLGAPEVPAATKRTRSRDIAIVFDNSGSMYSTTPFSTAQMAFAGLCNDSTADEKYLIVLTDGTFRAVYLDDYTIEKDGEALGWPRGGLQIALEPVKDFVLEVAGGQPSADPTGGSGGHGPEPGEEREGGRIFEQSAAEVPLIHQ